MEDVKKHPFLPPNFVTLSQLQERWLKDQQQKQKDEEDRKEREKKLQQQQHEKRRENRGNRRRSENRETHGTGSVPVHRGSFQSENNGRSIESGDSKPDDAAIVLGGSINDERQNVTDSKKKTSKRSKNKKTRVQKNLSEVIARLQQDKESEEGNLVVVTERNGDKEGIRRGLKGNGKSSALNGKGLESGMEENETNVSGTERNCEKEGHKFKGKGSKSAVSAKCWEKKTPVDRLKLKSDDLTLNYAGKMGENESVINNTGKCWEKKIPVDPIKLKLDDLTLNNGGKMGGKESVMNNNNKGKCWGKKIPVDRMKLKFDDLTLDNGGEMGGNDSVMKNNSGGIWHRSGCGKFDSWNNLNPRNPNLVWVKKGEISDAKATGI